MKITTAVKKIKKLEKRIRCIPGGTAAGKTIGIILYLIHLAQKDKTPTLTSIVSESFPHLKRGAIRDFLAILEEHKYFDPNRWNKTDYTYNFETGSKIEFFSVDQPGKVRGPRRDRLFINEANNVSFETFEQLEVRTKDFIFLDWNPTSEFWYYTELKHKESVEELILTYKDNEALDKAIIESIESRRDRAGWWKVYGEGRLGEIEGRIFTGWKMIDEVPYEARLERRWLDLGFTNDMTAGGDLYYYNGGYIVDEFLYQKGLKTKLIADTILSQPEPKALVVADSAEPRTISELKDYGVNVIGVSKTRGETKNETFVKWSIGLVQGEKISVTKRSLNIIKEHRNYFWLVDKNGKVLNVEDPKCANHHMRGIAYALSHLTPIKRKQELRRDLGRQQWERNQKTTNPV